MNTIPIESDLNELALEVSVKADHVRGLMLLLARAYTCSDDRHGELSQDEADGINSLASQISRDLSESLESLLKFVPPPTLTSHQKAGE